MIFHDCGMCPMIDLCERACRCRLFGEDKCPACLQGREVDLYGIKIHICNAAPKSSVTFTQHCPCECDLGSHTIVEPSDQL